MFDPTYARLRERMVEDQLVPRGIRDPAVIEAMGQIPREVFVSARYRDLAYDDGALPIDHGQTISQPYVVAWMAEALELRPTDRVLEIGTGSGYGAAILSRLCARVFTVERIDALSSRARRCVASLGLDNIEFKCDDGSLGWPANGPYDGIVVTAAGPRVPNSLVDQLADGGRLVMPVGPGPELQELCRVRKRGSKPTDPEVLGAVTFVPLIGREGFSPQ